MNSHQNPHLSVIHSSPNPPSRHLQVTFQSFFASRDMGRAVAWEELHSSGIRIDLMKVDKTCLPGVIELQPRQLNESSFWLITFHPSSRVGTGETAESTKPVLSIVIKRSVGFTFSNTRGKPKLTQLRGGQEESWPVSPHLERESREDWGFHCTVFGECQMNRALIVPIPAFNYQR